MYVPAIIRIIMSMLTYVAQAVMVCLVVSLASEFSAAHEGSVRQPTCGVPICQQT